MANIKPEELGRAVQEELTIYSAGVVTALDAAGEKAIKELVKKTKATAPVGRRKSYRKNIAGKLLKKSDRGNTYVWYVKPPDHRLTHLLVHGHATKSGGRTRANPFLANALKQVLTDYEGEVEEALKNGK